MGMGFDRMVRDVFDGRVDFTTFARSTRDRWEKLADYLLGRWRAPRWYSREDVVQELLLGAWSRMWDFDPRRGVALARYVVWNAVDIAKKALHKVRGAYRRDDRSPSVLPEVAVESFGEDAGEWLTAMGVEATQETRMQAAEQVLGACTNPRERRVMEAILATQCLLAGAFKLYDDTDVRLMFRMMSEEHAIKLTEQIALRVATRVFNNVGGAS